MTARTMALAVRGTAPVRPSRDDTGATAVRAHLFDDLFAHKYDESILPSPPRAGTGHLPGWLRLGLELRARSSEYDVIVTWSERVSLALMTLDKVLGAKKPHIAMMYWFSRPSVRLPARVGASSLHAIVTWSSVQRAYAIDRLGIAPEKIYLVRHFVDQLYFSPRLEAQGGAGTICSAGAEMRDYPTLIEALRGTGVPCHIATDHVRVDRLGFGRRVSADVFSIDVGDGITIGRKTPGELRDLYARSRFVVVPLRPSDTDNGVTVILEAMAMGKAVICSRTRGQVDVIEDGVTGIFVPVGDAGALRRAILSLWEDPARATAMGRAGRAYIEAHHSLEKFCFDVKAAIDASLDGRSAGLDGTLPTVRPAPAGPAPP
ncbi:MAG: glycosyltransferase family 4 protein [Polyangiaceae bacterium]